MSVRFPQTDRRQANLTSKQEFRKYEISITAVISNTVVLYRLKMYSNLLDREIYWIHIQQIY